MSDKLAAPNITMLHLLSLIDTEYYHRFAKTTNTACCLVLKNGFSVIGSAACASAKLGRDLAREDAIDKLWALEGYLLKQELHEQANEV